LGLITSRYEKLLASLSPIDVKQKDMDVKYFLYQLLSLGWIIFGVGYGIIAANFTLAGRLDRLLSFIALYGPGLFFAGIVRWLQRRYWSQNDRLG